MYIRNYIKDYDHARQCYFMDDPGRLTTDYAQF